VGIPIKIGLSTFGALILGSAKAHAVGFDAADQGFLRLVSTLVAVGIQRGQHEEVLDTLAFFDVLTGLPNRALLASRMVEMFSAASRRKLQCAVHYLDLDHFKVINDTFGHGAGDHVLLTAAHRMAACARAMDTVARVGGDEFVIVQELDEHGQGAAELAERIIAELSKAFSFEGHEYTISVSDGISIFPQDATDPTELLHLADVALLRTKRDGRNRYAYLTPREHDRALRAHR
jgi:diguanylate cyclase (GGDEF)-like protein